jgi:tetratricopeptide (TPR) repeat protein
MKVLRPLLLLLVLSFGTVSFAQGTDEQLAAQYMQQGDYGRAALYYDKLYKDQPSAFNYEQLFQCRMALKDYDEAEKLAKDQQRRQGDSRGLVDLGMVLKAKGENEKAEQQFDKAIKNMKDDQNAVRALANAFQKNNEFDRALQVYERGKKTGKSEGYSFDYEIAQLYGAKGDLPAMTSSYMDLLTVTPTYLQAVQNGLARYIDFTKSDARTDMLRTELLRRSQKNPDNTIFQEMLIWQYLQQKDLIGAFTQSKAMDKRFNEGGERLMELADMSVTNKEWSTAAKCYQYVLELGKQNPNYVPARMGLVRSLDARVTEQAEPPKAELDELVLQYNAALTDLGRSPQTTELLRGLAHVKAYYLNDRVGAITLYEEAINTNGVDPSNKARFKLDLGDVYMLDANIWEASLLYSQVDLDFKNDIIGHEARLRNAKVSFYSGDFLWAKAQLDILKASTSKLIANDAMELSLLITDNIGEDSTRSPLTQFSRAQLLTFQHRFDEALLTMDSLNIDFPLNSLGDDILYERFRIAYARHQYDTAAVFLQKVLEQYPNDILVDNALLDLGKLYEEKLNDKVKAQAYYEELMFKQTGSIFVPEARERFRHMRGDYDNLETPEQKFLNGPQ